jgi:Lon protease-like protein
VSPHREPADLPTPEPRVGDVERIPLFPLGTVLFPGLLLPLHIFEERYRLLVQELLVRPDGTARRFGVVAIREGREVGPDGITALHEIGCAAELRAVEPYDDGRYDIVTTGSHRFRLIGLDPSLPYLQAEVQWLPEPPGEAPGVLAGVVAQRFAAYRVALAALQGVAEPEDPTPLPDDPGVLSYLVSAAVVLDLADRQALLEAGDTTRRLRMVLALLKREESLLRHVPSLPGIEYARQPYSPN